MELERATLTLEILSSKIDDLIEIVREGFGRMVTCTEFNERLDRVESGLDSHDVRLDIIEEKLDDMEKKMNSTERRLNGMENKMDRLHDDMRLVKVKIGINA